MEVGCGVGNTVFPLKEINPNLIIFCFDFALSAIQLLKQSDKFEQLEFEFASAGPEGRFLVPLSAGRVHAFVCDAVTQEIKDVPDSCVDFVSLIFVLSAVHPDKMGIALGKIAQKMRRGGLVFFRDYASGDMAQARFSHYSKLDENLFVRQDGTRSYFFSKEFVSALFEKSGFEILENHYLEKTVVNVKEEKEMQRIFLQGKFRLK